ncbi:LIC_10190 family membrane protein [Vaginella massiliensis]|uniref:LIC_10190 family membrane protein n=1 Tax=Vaginella massiliensis TaxID=1816680 RepID=UPI0037529F7A
MILQLFIYLIVFFVCLGYGDALQQIIGQKSRNLAIQFIFGILLLATVFLLLGFFVPLDERVEVPLSIAGLVLSWIYRESIYRAMLNIKPTVVFYIMLGFTLYFSVQKPILYDHYSYYLPTVKYLNQLGLVKGIGNFELVLAQTSLWHILQAGFDNSLDVYFGLNGVLLVVFLIYTSTVNEQRLYLFIPFFLLLCSSLSTDLPVYILSLIWIHQMLINRNHFSFWMTFSVFIFCIKPTAFILILAVFGLYLMRKLKFVVRDFSFATFLVLLHFFKQIWLSSNPFFPVGFFNIQQWSWSIPVETYHLSGLYGRYNPLSGYFGWQEVMEMSTVEYYRNVMLNAGETSFLHLCTLLLMIGCIFLTYYKKHSILLFLSVMLLLKTIVVLLVSPQYRLNLDVLILSLFMLIYLSRIRTLWINLSLMVAVFGVLVVVFSPVPKLQKWTQTNRFNTSFRKFWFEPYQFQSKVYSLEKIELNGTHYFYVNRQLLGNYPVNTLNYYILKDWYQTGYYAVPIESENLKKGYQSIPIDEKIASQLDELFKKQPQFR